MGSQVVGKNQSRLSGRGTVGELGEEEYEEEERATEQKRESVHRFWF